MTKKETEAVYKTVPAVPIKKRRQAGTKAIREIKAQQSQSHLLIPTLSFKRVFDDMLHDLSNGKLRATTEARLAAQEAAEAFLIERLSLAQRTQSTYKKQVTLNGRDLRQVIDILGATSAIDRDIYSKMQPTAQTVVTGDVDLDAA